MDATISVALATYNGEQFVQQQLESLSAQTSPPHELVVSDDQSTDRTLEIVRAFARNAPFPVRIFQQRENVGYKKNFLECVALCKGQFVALCDQDDIWLPQKIETVKQLISDDISLVFHNANVVRDGAIVGKLYHIRDPFSYMPKGASFFTFSPWGTTMAFRSDLSRFSHLHALSRNPDVENATEVHDQWFHFLAILVGTVAYSPDLLVQYRQHGRNAIGWGRGRLPANLARNIFVAASRQRSLLACVQGRISVIEQLGIPLSRNGTVVRNKLKEIERLLQVRQSIYGNGHIGVRAASLLRLLFSGQYTGTSSKFRLGYKGLAKDLVVGLLLHPLLDKLGASAPTGREPS